MSSNLPLLTGLALLRAQKATQVVVEYSGSGDSGDIDRHSRDHGTWETYRRLRPVVGVDRAMELGQGDSQHGMVE